MTADTNDHNDPNGYVLMAHNDNGTYDGWWHPMGVYTDSKAVKAAKAEAQRRIPGLHLSIETVPLDKSIAPAPWPDGRIWTCGFSYEQDGSWCWDPGIYPMEDDELADQIYEPFDLYQLVDVGETTAVYYGDAIQVLADSKEQAAERAKPLVDAYVTEQTGKAAQHGGYA